jgi:group I intron endonuclease
MKHFETTMPQANYQNAYIYKLVNSVDDKIYIGSSCCEPRQRFWKHKNDRSRYPDRKIYQHLNAIGWNNVRIIVLEWYSCSNRHELLLREQEWVNRLRPELNKNTPGRNVEESKRISRKKAQSTPFICGCGSRTSIAEKSKHFKTIKHRFYESMDGLNAIDV